MPRNSAGPAPLGLVGRTVEAVGPQHEISQRVGTTAAALELGVAATRQGGQDAGADLCSVDSHYAASPASLSSLVSSSDSDGGGNSASNRSRACAIRPVISP